MKKLLLALLLAGCSGYEGTACYGNHTCNEGLICIGVKGEYYGCVKPDSVSVWQEDGQHRMMYYQMVPINHCDAYKLNAD